MEKDKRFCPYLLEGLPRTIPVSKLPSSNIPEINKESKDNSTANLNDNELIDALKKRIDLGDSQSHFQLGQLYFFEGNFEESFDYFKSSIEQYDDPRSKFQLSIILYDNLAPLKIAKFYTHPLKTACDFMREITKLPINSNVPKGQRELIHAAAYNLGRAYYQGYGVRQSDKEAIDLWTFAADDGNPLASVIAQTVLGYVYCGVENQDFKKSFFWHTEACGNGSVESQAAIGAMYLYGISVPQEWCSAIVCLTEAASKGSLHAQGNLVYLFYKRRLYTQAAYIASRVVLYTEEEVAEYCAKDESLLQFARRAVAMAAFILARCLDRGVGVLKDSQAAEKMYSRCFEWDHNVCMRYQNMTNRSEL